MEKDEDLFQSMTDWLAGMEVDLGDVLSDEKGYYILVEDEVEYNPEKSAEFEIKHNKVYLPEVYQKLEL